MNTTIRLLALATLWIAPTVVPRLWQEAGPALEPPLRYRVTVGDETVELEAGKPVTPREGGLTWLVEVLPTRVLRMEGAFSFEYPHALSFLGAEGPGGGWWTLSDETTSIHLQRHFEDPDVVVERYVANSVATGARDVRPARLELDGRTLTGHAFDLHLGGFHGWEAESIQEVFGFEAGGASWLITLQRTLETSSGPGGAVFDQAAQGHAVPMTYPNWRQSEHTARTLELYRESFRFEDR